VLKTVLFTDSVGSTERAIVLGDCAWHELPRSSPGRVGSISG
jgi:hypothetical protein